MAEGRRAHSVPNDLDLRQRLRAATDPEHRELDAFMGAIWEDRDAYRAYIAMNEMAYRAIEPLVVEALRSGDHDLAYSPVHARLAQDLARLGGRTDGPAPRLHAENLGLPEAVGAIYVLEGSHLGARMLHARTIAAPWFSSGPRPPTAFFEAARSTGNFNRRMAELRTLLADEACVERTTAFARAAFALFREAAERTRNTPSAHAAQKALP